jgi:TolB-like protein/DNA-binding winged helix-turn-helix (wHTH) protein/Flp pilus assembly protein TadD
MEPKFCVGDWLVRPRLNRVEGKGGVVRLEPKVMQVLVCMAERPGEVFSKEELLRSAWADTFVTDEVLTRAISELRRVFQDDAKAPHVIETVQRGGYRLMAPTSPTPNPALDSIVRSRARVLIGVAAGIAAVLAVVLGFWGGWAGLSRPKAVHANIESVAVLPLDNLSADKEQEYFVDGMTDELINRLASVKSLRVISRTSVMQYKSTRKPLPEIARALNVAAIVEGSSFRAGNRVRITVQLVDGRSDVHLWAQSFERNLDDVLSLQAEVAEAVARAVGLRLTTGEQGKLLHRHTNVPAAYDAYLRGRYRWTTRTRRGLQDSIMYFKEAIAADPTYALAYAALADSYVVQVDNGWLTRSDGYPLIKRAATQALQIDADLAEGHQMFGVVREEEWDWAAAEREYVQAINLNPGLARAHHWYAVLLAALNRPDEAIAEIKRAVELDPMGINLYCVESRVYYLAHRFEEALIPLQSLKQLNAALPVQHLFTGLAYIGQRRYSDAVVEMRAVTEAEPDDPEELAYLACAYALAGRRSDALQTLAAVNQLAKTTHVDPVLLAIVWISLGDNDQAFHYLSDAYRTHSSFLINLAVDPLYDPLRQDPRFADLVHRVGLSH